MMISDVLERAGRHRRRKRIGRGAGSGHGKTSGRGHKGQGQRAGSGPNRLSEGGQMKFFRRIPKRGFSNAQYRTEYQVVNVASLEKRFNDGDKVTPEALEQAGLIRTAKRPVKILANGEITKKLDVEATRFSTHAAMKITRAGGQIRTPEGQAEADQD